MLFKACIAKNVITQNVFITLRQHKKENNNPYSRKSPNYMRLLWCLSKFLTIRNVSYPNFTEPDSGNINIMMVRSWENIKWRKVGTCL
jgi:hypothetical protein